jgi:hypothetical protein
MRWALESSLVDCRMNSFGSEQRQCRAPVTGYRETRDNGRLQWRVTAKQGTMTSFGGGLLRNQRQRRHQRRVTAKSGTKASTSGGLPRNQGQRRAPVAGYRESRRKGGLQWRVTGNQGQRRIQWRVTAKPGTKAGSSGGLLRHQEQWWVLVAGYFETEAVNCMNCRMAIRFVAAVLAFTTVVLLLLLPLPPRSSSLPEGLNIFQHIRSHLKIEGARRVTSSTYGPQTAGGTLQILSRREAQNM